MPLRTATALGVLTLVATAVLTTTGTAAADSNGGRAGAVLRDGRLGPDGWVGQAGRIGQASRVGQVGRHGRFGLAGAAGSAGRLYRPAGRDVGAVTIGKHTNAPSTASHNWGGGNWNSKVTFGDMILD
ncbi:hypothetical protein ACH4OW_07465 [Streptomyces sp. NPDC017056]|uniref:hypothetical protein n=1 Tax=Streptomyces sp. NPDC017056 TaxID=3364973 RepID=UPI0037BC40E0